jgi:hypothetical protein
MQSSDPAQQLQSTRGVRQLLSVEGSPPVHAVVEAGIVPLLAAFLTRADEPDLLFEVNTPLPRSKTHSVPVCDRHVY